MKKSVSNLLCGLAAVAVVAGCGVGLYYGNKSVRSWFDSVGAGSLVSSSAVHSVSEDGTLALAAGARTFRPARISGGAWSHDDIEVSASVNADATVKTVAWSFAFVTPGFVTGDVSLYFSIVSTTETSSGSKAVVHAIKGWHDTDVRLTATTVDGASAYVDFDYYVGVVSATLAVANNASSAGGTGWTQEDLQARTAGYSFKSGAFFCCLKYAWDSDDSLLPEFLYSCKDMTDPEFSVAQLNAAFAGHTNLSLGSASTSDLTVEGFVGSHLDLENNCLYFGFHFSGHLSGDSWVPSVTVDGVSAALDKCVFQYVPATVSVSSGSSTL